MAEKIRQVEPAIRRFSICHDPSGFLSRGSDVRKLKIQRNLNLVILSGNIGRTFDLTE